jgi:hypothetical protein
MTTPSVVKLGVKLTATSQKPAYVEPFHPIDGPTVWYGQDITVKVRSPIPRDKSVAGRDCLTVMWVHGSPFLLQGIASSKVFFAICGMKAGSTFLPVYCPAQLYEVQGSMCGPHALCTLLLVACVWPFRLLNVCT